jgi:hypothetical protein
VNAPSRLDRELNELLQELRVIQGGILLLVGFLLVIAFSAGFVDGHVTAFQRLVYFLTLLVTGLSAIVVVAPVVHHRMAFRKHDKERVIVRGNAQILIAIFLVAFSILGITVLITDYLYRLTWLTAAVGVAYIVITLALWWVLPRHSLRQAASEHDHVIEH